MRKGSFQLVLLQEKKLEKVYARFNRWFCGCMHFQCEAVPSVGHSGGIITCWDVNFFELDRVIKAKRFIFLIKKLKGLDFQWG